MGRCVSTPGLVERKGKTTLEDMWIAPVVPAVNTQNVPPTLR
jgi:cyclic nucleotide gated channel alpha 3